MVKYIINFKVRCIRCVDGRRRYVEDFAKNVLTLDRVMRIFPRVYILSGHSVVYHSV